MVVGGGIAGLYCAQTLAVEGYAVEVLEATGRFGGRCETADFEPGPDGGPVPFKAEFGPMRFELDIQPLLSGLLDQFSIPPSTFPQPTSAKLPFSYPLEPAERAPSGRVPSPLQLLKFGVFRMFGWRPRFVDVIHDGQAAAEVELPDGATDWLNSLGDDDGSFDQLRRTAELPGYRPLRELGFWNALYTTLSPLAVASILHFGTFYHLMPDNPNAVEWAIFWLRLFQPGGSKLSTIPSGVQQLTDSLARELTDHPAVDLKLNHEVAGVRAGGRGKLEVFFTGGRPPTEGDHVILALPKQPLVKLDTAFPDRIRADFDSVVPVPLLKVFCVTKTPEWWSSPQKPQERAWALPTREIHYLPLDALKDNTLVLIYTDKPANAFWQPFVGDLGFHREAEINRNKHLKEALRRVLFELHWAWASEWVRLRPGAKPWYVREPDGRRVLRALSDFAELTRIDKSDPVYPRLARERPALVGGPASILFHSEEVWNWQLGALGYYGIRDWACPPFGAACHAWKPGVNSWEVRRRLAGFALAGEGERNQQLHVCGEAYSDYQGFIEGALRSAREACQSILRADATMEAA